MHTAPMLRALKHRPFRDFFVGQAVSQIGFWLQSVALSWLVYRSTRSPVMLATVAFAGTLPMLVLSPFAGALIDHFDRRKVLLSTQTVQMLQSLALALIAFSDAVQMAFIVPLALLRGVAWTFDLPARQTLLPLMVGGRGELPNAIALSSSVMNMARFIGPAIAGLLLAWTEEGWCFLLNALSFIPVILAIARLPSARPTPSGASAISHLVDGFRWVWGFAPARWLLAHLLVLSLTVPAYQAMVPIFAGEVHHGDSRTQGLLVSCAGLGALAGTLMLASRASVYGLVRVINLASASAAIGLVLFAQTGHLALACIGLAAVGFGFSVAGAGTNTILQSVVDDARRGRVVSIYAMCYLGVMPIGTLAAGFLADRFGAPACLSGLGLVCLTGSLGLLIAYPRVRGGLRAAYDAAGIKGPASRAPPDGS